MSPPRANPILLPLCTALAIAFSGCMGRWSPPFSEGKNVHPLSTPNAAAAADKSSLTQNAAEPSATDMAGVMDKLAQIRELDPAAEQKLLEELRKAPPSSWPLVAEQYRASLAYHQQLTSKPHRSEQKADPMAEFRRMPPTDASADSISSRPKRLTPPSLASNDRPSSAFGDLNDPHGSSSEYDAVVAQASTLTAPAAGERTPAEFVASGPAYPINSRSNEAQTAALEVPASEPVHVATQALAKTDAALEKQSTRPSPRGRSDDETWQQNVEQAMDDLSRRVAASPTTTAEVHQHVSLRLLRLLAGDTEKALEPIPHIPPAEQDYWSRQIFALATYLDHHSQPEDKRRAAASVAHLDEAVAHLRELGSLSLRNLAFCKNVYGYGAFESYDNDIFSPGQQVSLYVEVENYHSESTEKGYCTLLGATYELFDDKGKRVSGGDFPDVDDCCRSRRRDFHIQFGLTIPANLTPGRYRVELVVKDRKSDKLGHATLPFETRSAPHK
jgi:hypothetical protein